MAYTVPMNHVDRDIMDSAMSALWGISGEPGQVLLGTRIHNIEHTLQSAQGFVPVPLDSFQATDATNLTGRLSSGSAPDLDMTNGDTNSTIRISWVAANVTAIINQVALPPDVDGDAAVVVHALAMVTKAGGAIVDTPVINGDFYFNGVATKIEAACAAVATGAYVEKTFTLAAADVPATPQVLTMELTPAAHTTDSLQVCGVWVEYTKKLLTS
jgi:hypothetical protein